MTGLEERLTQLSVCRQGGNYYFTLGRRGDWKMGFFAEQPPMPVAVL